MACDGTPVRLASCGLIVRDLRVLTPCPVQNPPFNLVKPMAVADAMDDNKIREYVHQKRKEAEEAKRAKDEQEKRLFGSKQRTPSPAHHSGKAGAGAARDAESVRSILPGKDINADAKQEQREIDQFKASVEQMLLLGLFIRLIRYDTFGDTLSYW
jgi:hypothetical protein